MIRRLLLSLCLIGFAVPALHPQQTLTAAALAKRIDHHYNSLRSLKVDFTQEYSGLGTDVKESGTLLLKKPGRMRWDYTRPAGKLFVLDGKNAYFYAPGQSEAQRVPAKKLDDLRSPLSLLLGHTEIEKELTGLKLIPSSGPDFRLSGIPRGMAQRVASLEITADAQGTILAMRIDETDGAVNTFTFTEEQLDAPAPGNLFLFHAPAGVNIVDGMPPV